MNIKCDQRNCQHNPSGKLCTTIPKMVKSGDYAACHTQKSRIFVNVGGETVEVFTVNRGAS